ncbi:hypothetical protein TNCV_3006291 [Trichonephila clavipes]|nr:hypothetical protein TNCV_3006291 [Trichonephila clavipes]
MLSDGTEFAVGDIQKLFDEARRNSKAKHEKGVKYCHKRRRDVRIQVNERVLEQTHPLSSVAKRVGAKFKPKFEGCYRVLEIMFDPSSFANPTPLAHADTTRDVLPRGDTSQSLKRILKVKVQDGYIES